VPAEPFSDRVERVSGPPMTVVYGGERWYLDAHEVRVHRAGEEPRTVAHEALPLPVARVLRTLGPAPAAEPAEAA
jgi:hypothetical protein